MRGNASPRGKSRIVLLNGISHDKRKEYEAFKNMVFDKDVAKIITWGPILWLVVITGVGAGVVGLLALGVFYIWVSITDILHSIIASRSPWELIYRSLTLLLLIGTCLALVSKANAIRDVLRQFINTVIAAFRIDNFNPLSYWYFLRSHPSDRDPLILLSNCVQDKVSSIYLDMPYARNVFVDALYVDIIDTGVKPRRISDLLKAWELQFFSHQYVWCRRTLYGMGTLLLLYSSGIAARIPVDTLQTVAPSILIAAFAALVGIPGLFYLATGYLRPLIELYFFFLVMFVFLSVPALLGFQGFSGWSSGGASGLIFLPLIVFGINGWQNGGYLSFLMQYYPTSWFFQTYESFYVRPERGDRAVLSQRWSWAHLWRLLTDEWWPRVWRFLTGLLTSLLRKTKEGNPILATSLSAFGILYTSGLMEGLLHSETGVQLENTLNCSIGARAADKLLRDSVPVSSNGSVRLKLNGVDLRNPEHETLGSKTGLRIPVKKIVSLIHEGTADEEFPFYISPKWETDELHYILVGGAEAQPMLSNFINYLSNDKGFTNISLAENAFARDSENAIRLTSEYFVSTVAAGEQVLRDKEAFFLLRHKYAGGGKTRWIYMLSGLSAIATKVAFVYWLHQFETNFKQLEEDTLYQIEYSLGNVEDIGDLYTETSWYAANSLNISEGPNQDIIPRDCQNHIAVVRRGIELNRLD